MTIQLGFHGPLKWDIKLTNVRSVHEFQHYVSFLGLGVGPSKEQNNKRFGILVRGVEKSEACTVKLVLSRKLEQLFILCSLLIVLVEVYGVYVFMHIV